MENIKEFKCNRCGCCCKNIRLVEEAMHLDRGDGICKYYSEEEKKCIIYDFRPDICRVDKMYKRFKDNMTYDEYLKLSYDSCEELRELEKNKKLDKTEEIVVENSYFD